MSKRFAKRISVLSIATLLAAVVTVSTAAVSTAPTAEAEAATVTFAPVPQTLQAKVETTTVKAAKPAAAPMHREMRRAVSKDAKDWKGYERSLYRGKYYHKDQEHFRECVMFRESRHNYRAANKTSSARGAYQFLDNSWRDGLVYMMVKESKKTDDGLNKRIKRLFDKPIEKWDRYMQDRAFFTAMNINGKWSGKHHWRFSVPGSSC